MRLINTLGNSPSPLEKLVHNAQLTGIHSTPSFLKNLFEKGIVNFPYNLSSTGYGFRSEAAKERALEQFLQILDIVKLQYKQNADVNFLQQASPYSETTIFIPVITVLYPKIEVINSLGKKHTIKNLVVMYSFKVTVEGNLLLENIRGLRFCVTQSEYEAQHRHSHLPSNTFIEAPFLVSPFCLGSNTDIRNCEFSLSQAFSLEKYEMLFFLMDSMVKWESLEGVPHNKISRVKLVQYVSCPEEADLSYTNIIERFIAHLQQEEVRLDLNFYPSEKYYRIHNDDKAKAFLLSAFKRANIHSLSSDVLVYRIPSTNTYVRGKTKRKLINPSEFNSTDYWIFKGEKIYPKILKDNPNTLLDLSSQEAVLHPKFIKDVIRKLEYEIYKETIGSYGVNSSNSNRDEPNSVSSNTVSL